MFAYPCPSCTQRLLAPIGRVGQRSICPKCLQPLTVPHPDHVSAGPFAPATAAEPCAKPYDLAPRVADGGHDTPQPMNTFPTGMGRAHEFADSPTEPFIDLFRERSDQDEAAGLSAAVTMRMAPPPDPTPDRTYVVWGWVVATLVGATVWVLGVGVSAAWLPYTALVGGGMIAFGVLWRAYLSGRGGAWLSGLVSALPPVCLVQLLRPVNGYGWKPLGFVLTGAGLCGLFAVGQPAKRWVDERFGTPVIPAAEPTPADPAAEAEQAAVRLGERATRGAAKTTLLRLGPAAEPAVRTLLTSNSTSTVLAACEVLEQIGTERSLGELRELADSSDTPRAVRIEAVAAAEAIEKRASVR